MKAFILAAGFGTRLLPHTKTLPKPLFTIENKTLLKRVTDLLTESGFKEIYINTHHLHQQIEDYIKKERFQTKIHIEHEKEILNTGGAIRNISKKSKGSPLLVINADILTSIDLKKVYDTHISKNHMVTMVLCKNRFNNVEICGSQIRSIGEDLSDDSYTFTGIQVISPEVIHYFEDKRSSIDAYKKMMTDGIEIHHFIMDKDTKWDDLGTIESIARNNIEAMIKRIDKSSIISITKVEGDGSDRLWSRIETERKSYIAVNHGIAAPSGSPEASSFFKIARHLESKKINVPKLYAFDLLSGTGILEDLGKIRLQDVILETEKEDEKFSICRGIMDSLFEFSSKGISGFTDDMTWQTKTYSKEVSFNECMYFKNEFLEDLLGISTDQERLEKEFTHIAENAVSSQMEGLMHRDFQSRNIMMRDNTPFFIDFQGARRGPVQYDLASFIIDPYVDFSDSLKEKLLDYAIEKAKEYNFPEKEFVHSYRFCALSRNLQMLGAFSFLSMKKNKGYFKQYIPKAVKNLKNMLLKTDYEDLKYLKEIISKI